MSKAVGRFLIGLVVSMLLLFSIPASAASTWRGEVAEMCQQLHQVVILQYKGQYQQAAELASRSYFEHYDTRFEPFLRRIQTNSYIFTVEQQFNQVIALLRDPKAQQSAMLYHLVASLCTGMRNDAAALKAAGILHPKQQHSPWAAALQGFLILLREGFEALLVITALLAYAKRKHAKAQCRAIYTGAVTAIAASIATAYAFIRLFASVGAQREIVEGVSLLLTATLLLYVSFWLFSKREGQAWQQYLKEKTEQALSRKSEYLLGSAAFLAVYREGAETILFYNGILNLYSGQQVFVFAGIAAAIVALVVLAKLMQRATLKIPYRFFFSATALFLYVMAVVFVGAGVQELQEVGWISYTALPWLPDISWLAIYPSVQAFSAQCAFLLPMLIGGVWWGLKGRHLRAPK